ncbi:nuclear pore complex protein NUP205 [Typha angustifolia]|uniref:nuclear pore complex protein NUP205 n=1 Tax=Typha angustifolia TaxID=59011 RepID=UPI003C2E570C
MVSPHELLSAIEAGLLGPSPPTPSQRIEIMHAIRASLPHLQSLLSYPGPKASDRAQVQSKEVRLPDSPPISLDDTDVEIALKLSDDLNLNEIECVRLLVSTNREWLLYGREPLEIYRLAAGLWYMERRDLITSLYTLLRSVVLDQGLDADLVADVQKLMEDLFDSVLRQRLIVLIKELSREDPAGVGHPNAERYVLDFRGAFVERHAIVSRERLSLSHCLVLSVLITRMSPKDVKDVFSSLKDCAAEVNGDNNIQLQITFGLLFSLVIAFTSDALCTVPDQISMLSDASFRKEFHELVMTTSNNPNVEGFLDIVRLAWTVHLVLTEDQSTSRDTFPRASPSDYANVSLCLELICSNNVFQSLLSKVLQTAAYQNDDEDMVYMYNGYLHKLLMCFLSNPHSRHKVKEMKEKAMSSLNPYVLSVSDDFRDDTANNLQQGGNSQPFVSLLELVREIYQKEPELLHGNEELWTFVTFAGEDHTNIQTLVAFLRLLSTLASNEEGASKVYELLRGKTFRSIGWNTLFDCLSIYEEKFKQSLQTSGTLLPDFQEGDAQALVAYLNVLQKVVENGNLIERKRWFPDIEPLFKLLSYENVPPYLKGALRNAITAFIRVSPALRDTIWNYLEQYDLPVVVGPSLGNSGQPMSTQVYDMRFELNEVESRRERYPSTISFLNLLNALIAEERNVSDRGRRFVGIFRFVYDHVFGPFPQRAYADSIEKWQLIIACLQHFKMILSMYDIKGEDYDSIADVTQPSSILYSSSIETQIPPIELLKDFMSGKIVFRNIMSIILLGVNAVIHERTSQIYGLLLEKAVHLSLEIVILVMERDLLLADFWRPLYQPLDVILSQDHKQIVALLEYVRYDFLPQIQLCSIKIMSTLSSRMVGLVQLLLKSGAAKSLVDDFATCLELHFDECQVIENTKDDPGVLILQLLIDNLSRPAPNVTHLFLRFDVDHPIERTSLRPKFHYSCLKVILDNLEKLSKPDMNALLHEFSFQLLYELCLDPLTCGPTMDLLSTKKYQFFTKHLETIGVAPLPKRNNNQALRISTLHQRAWLLKLLALELHVADMAASAHRESCLVILSRTFGQCVAESCRSPNISVIFQTAGNGTMDRNMALELLDVVQFRSPDTSTRYPLLSNLKCDIKVEDILHDSGMYYYSERGDRLIDLDAFHDKLWQMCAQVSSHLEEAEKGELRESFHQLLRWGWRYNKNLEEQAAQLHMLTGWSQLVEIAVSRRMSLLEDRSQILFELLDASLTASASPDCSLKMAVILTHVALTCMAKLRDERFLCPSGVDSDSVTCLDIISGKQLSNGACHSILFKLMMTILRNESSEPLRRRQYALLLSYFQYCGSILDPDVPASVLQYLLTEERDGDDEMNLQKIDRDQHELARANFSIIRKESQAIIDVITKDATHGSEAAKAISLYVLDAFVGIDHEKFFLNQLQSRGILRSCLMEISNYSSKDATCSLESFQRMCTVDAQLSLLLRISHNYGRHGSQILFSMGAMEHLGSCRVIDFPSKGGSRWVGGSLSKEREGKADKQRLLVTPILRLVSCLTSLVDSSDFLEVKNKVAREVVNYVKVHQSLFDQILREDISRADEFTLERVNLVVSILSKVWPYEESDEYGFVQSLFSMMSSLFSLVGGSSHFLQSSDSLELIDESLKKSEILKFQLCFSLSCYLYFLVSKKVMMLHVLDGNGNVSNSAVQQPTLQLLLALLNSVAITMERAGEEKVLLLNKIQEINELSRQEVDEIIKVCIRRDCISSGDNIRKRRYTAIIEMCRMAGNMDQLITLLIKLAECVLNILLIHFQDEKCDPQNLSLLSGNLYSILERLEQLKEDKIGHSLKLFHRSVSTLKEMSIRYVDRS